MLRPLALLLILTVRLVHAAPVVVARGLIDQVVVFGDSLSDDGHGSWMYTNHTWPSDPHYASHRFSNGHVYAEYLSRALGVKLRDYAIGGATTNNALVQGYTGAGSSIPVPSLLDQLNTFLTHTPPSHKEAQKILWVVYAGGNNAFFSSPDSDIVEETVDDLQTAIRRIKSIGGTHFLLATLPPLGTRTPYSELADAPTAEHLARFSHEYRTRIYDVARHDPTITVVDFYVLFKRFRITPELYGFDPDKIADSCLTGVYHEVPGGVTACSNPQKYIWWDEFHPTARSHSLMGYEAHIAVVNKGWAQ